MKSKDVKLNHRYCAFITSLKDRGRKIHLEVVPTERRGRQFTLQVVEKDGIRGRQVFADVTAFVAEWDDWVAERESEAAERDQEVAKLRDEWRQQRVARDAKWLELAAAFEGMPSSREGATIKQKVLEAFSGSGVVASAAMFSSDEVETIARALIAQREGWHEAT
jgi:hypothetical protein